MTATGHPAVMRCAGVEIVIAPARASDLPTIGAVDRLVLGADVRYAILADAITAGHCWAAWQGGRIIGYAVCAPSFFGQWFIELLIVHPEARRHGVASALIRHCESICPTRKLFTSTNASNVPMQRVLDTLGYARSGFIENLDEGDPELIYVKHLPLATN